MIRKIGILGVSLLCLAFIISCEKDFNDIGTSIVKNTKFKTNQIDLELEISPVDVEAIRADNLGATISDYWLGVYNSQNYKTIESSIVGQLGFIKNPKTQDLLSTDSKGDMDSTFILDKVILKLPYTATSKGKEDDGKPKFQLDSVLGNPDIATSIKVYRNGTFLNTLDPNNPSQVNSFQSDYDYLADELLNEDAGFTFKPSAVDTMYTVTRHHGNGTTFESDEKLNNKSPFIAIPLNTARMKDLFWDRFGDSEFASSQEFNAYFRGLIIKAEGSDGSMVPLKLQGTAESASVEFYYTITRSEKLEDNASLTHKDTIPTKYSFPLSGVRNSIYKTSAASNAVPANNFVIQGTAGQMAQVKVLGVNLTKLKQNDPENPILKYENRDTNPQDGYLDLKELASIKDEANGEFGLLINDASLALYINQTVNTDKNILPQRIILFTGEAEEGVSQITKLSEIKDPTQISDAHAESSTFGGNLVVTDEKPEQYILRITDYISNILDRTSTDFSPLFLKVYNNPTDSPFRNRILETNVLSYNWDPRGVTLLNENETANGTKRAVLKLSYSEKK